MDTLEWTEQIPVTADNLNDMQDILNDNITNAINNQSKIIWTNSSPTSSFASQTITLDESLSNYDCYEILFRQNKTSTNERYMSTGKIPVGHGTILNYVTSSNFYRPTGTSVSGNTISFENAYAGSTANNDNIIPLYVIGHKTGLTF